MGIFGETFRYFPHNIVARLQPTSVAAADAAYTYTWLETKKFSVL
jgi:hypothetical protein